MTDVLKPQPIRGSREFLADFIFLGHKLEQLGFTYYKGKVTTISSKPIDEE